ncbi:MULTISPECIES: hypothetical protein [unclassified Paraflavitalea]|uniref:hypothetical protein n=1 Tax=unclassified Paraflavitalea TaxID=2798305 RepID=UPI003D32D25D
MELTKEQFEAIVAKLGTEAAKVVAKEMETASTKIKESVSKETISKEDFEGLKKAQEEGLKKINEICEKQGTSINEILASMSTKGTKEKSIADCLKYSEDELKQIYNNRSGVKYFMINVGTDGKFKMTPFDPTQKAAGPHSTTANVGGAGNTSSIAQSIDAATLLRLGAQSPIVSQYRNTPWILDLINLQNAGFDLPFAMWYEEQAKQGSSSTVAEGATKPQVQYAYTLKTATYKKEAMLIGFSEEFSLDFARLQDDILGKGRVDLVNRINSAILANVITNAQAFNSAVAFKQGVVVPNGNDFDAIAALAAQVDSNTFGAIANTAVMSTFKKYRMGITKSTTGEYIDRPSVLDNLAFVGNPDLTADQLIVGDFKQYNAILRGGLIVRVGYNGTDFAQNMFSTVIEQYYYDYISALRVPAIVKGPDFATVKTAITT